MPVLRWWTNTPSENGAPNAPPLLVFANDPASGVPASLESSKVYGNKQTPVPLAERGPKALHCEHVVHTIDHSRDHASKQDLRLSHVPVLVQGRFCN
jgi:hypothetical protein